DELLRRPAARGGPASHPGGPDRLPDSQPALRDVPDGPAPRRGLPKSRSEPAGSVPVLRVLPKLALAALGACATRCGSASPAPPAPAESSVTPGAAAATPTPSRRRGATTPVPSVTVPPDTAASGIVYRVGLKSDVAEFVYGPPGQRWIVAAGGRAEILRGPLRFRAEGPAAGGFQVQAGAFSQEEPAREKADRLAADLETTGVVAFSADRGVYRVLLGGFADRAGAEALADKVRAAGEEGLVVEGRMS